jgi:DNA-binding NarL/FixJ family response regulator
VFARLHIAQALSAAKATFPEAPVVVIGDACNRNLVVTALATGAATFLDENADPSTLIKQFEFVAQGEPVIERCEPIRTLDGGIAISVLLEARQLRPPLHPPLQCSAGDL